MKWAVTVPPDFAMGTEKILEEVTLK